MVTTPAPFAVERIVSSSGEVGELGSGAVQVDPRGSLQVTVGLDAASVDRSGTLDPATARRNVAGALTFTFADGSTTEIGLTGALHYPILSTSASEIDFGTVRNGATQTLVIKNSGRSPAPWRIDCPSGVFACVEVGSGAVEGVLEAFTSHTAAISTTLEVTYNPAGDCQSHSEVLILCSPIHEPIEVALRGVGTVDEKFA